MRTPTLPTVHRLVSISVPILLFVTLAAWAFSSTVGSSPDDDFHLASIWCGLGLREGLCEESGNPATRLVPAALVDATCFIRDSAISGACWDPGREGLTEATWMNAIGLYPPVFYAAMSVFVGPDIQTSVLMMRLFNAALAVGFLTTVFFALPRQARPALIVSTLVATVPLGLFILASTNPSSWALVSAATVWICLYGAFTTVGRRRVVLCGLAVAGALLGAGARGDAAAFAVFAVAIAFTLGAGRGRALLLPGIAAAVIAVSSGVSYLTTGQGSLASTGLDLGESEPLASADHISNLLGIPGLWLGAFGTAPLGWLDTSLPALVPVLAFGAYCAALSIGIRAVSRRRGVALALTVLALWVAPFILLAQSGYFVASNLVQPRYILPLLIILLSLSALTARAEVEWSLPRVVVIGSALSIAASVSLHINIRRYTTGADQPSIDPGAAAEWWWPIAPSPMLVWVIGSLAFALVFALLALLQRAGSRSSELQRADADEPTAGSHPVDQSQPSRAAEGSPAPEDPASDSA